MKERSLLTRWPLRRALTLIISLPGALILLVLLAAPVYAGLEVCADLWGWDWMVCEETHHTSIFGVAGALVAAGSAMIGTMVAGS